VHLICKQLTALKVITEIVYLTCILAYDT